MCMQDKLIGRNGVFKSRQGLQNLAWEELRHNQQKMTMEMHVAWCVGWGGVQVGAVAGRDVSMTVVQHTDPWGTKQNTWDPHHTGRYRKVCVPIKPRGQLPSAHTSSRASFSRILTLPKLSPSPFHLKEKNVELRRKQGSQQGWVLIIHGGNYSPDECLTSGFAFLIF